MSLNRLFLLLLMTVSLNSCIEIITRVNPVITPNLSSIKVSQSGWAGTTPIFLSYAIDGNEDTSTDEGITLGDNTGLIDFDLGQTYSGKACIKMQLRSIHGLDARWEVLTRNDFSEWQEKWHTVEFPTEEITAKLIFCNFECQQTRYIQIRTIGKGSSSAAIRLYELIF
jgi:hypothetical protein